MSENNDSMEEAEATRSRIKKVFFERCMNEILDMLRQAGNKGVDMTSILAHLNAIPADNQDKKELDVGTVNRMFATLKKHGCNYRFDHSNNRYYLNDTTWQMPVEIFLSSADQIALRIGWDILIQSLGTTHQKRSSLLLKSYEITKKKLNGSLYSKTVHMHEQNLIEENMELPQTEQVFMDLSYSLKTGKPVLLSLESNSEIRTPGIYLVKKLVLETSGWVVTLVNYENNGSLKDSSEGGSSAGYDVNISQIVDSSIITLAK